MVLRDLIRDIFSTALSNLANQQIEARIENARDERFGDFACTSAMDNRIRELCGIKNPRELATKLEQKLIEQNSKQQIFTKIEIAGPGFINVTLSPDFLYQFILQANQDTNQYGNTKTNSPRNIIFEFVSANPTGPLNVVSARAAALGDSCCNLLEAAGEKVFREYYVNDYGNQVNLLGISCLFRILELQNVPIKFASKNSDGNAQYQNHAGLPFPVEAYHGEYLKEIISLIQDKINIPKTQLNRLSKLSQNTNLTEADIHTKILDDELNQIAAELGKLAVSQFLESQKNDLAAFKVEFDQFFRESTLHQDGAVLKVADDLKDYISRQDGKTLFLSSQFGDDKDRVIIRDDGRPTYLLADIAYHQTKIKRGFSHIFDIWGPDHHGYITRLSGAMQALGFVKDRFQVIIAQQVNLLENGEPVVMSKRTGKIITLNELIQEIPIDVVRYFFTMRSFDTHLDFDLTEAKDTSEKNPYYYVAYAHARICSILKKAEDQNRTPTLTKPNTIDWSDERRRLLVLVARFPEEVKEAALNFEPHRLISFLYQVATATSRFYGQKENKIIDLDQPTAVTLLTVLQAVAICLKNGLALLGMSAPNRLDRDQTTADTE
ncbi:MAG: arginine--tRNA ligase [Leptonema sp. (in: Bacteria)]|nr:arginine--tRNA ligase [Leptonema sp. (in: bacteria)]